MVGTSLVGMILVAHAEVDPLITLALLLFAIGSFFFSLTFSLLPLLQIYVLK